MPVRRWRVVEVRFHDLGPLRSKLLGPVGIRLPGDCASRKIAAFVAKDRASETATLRTGRANYRNDFLGHVYSIGVGGLAYGTRQLMNRGQHRPSRALQAATLLKWRGRTQAASAPSHPPSTPCASSTPERSPSPARGSGRSPRARPTMPRASAPRGRRPSATTRGSRGRCPSAAGA